MNNYCVITTINKPTKAIEALYEKFGKNLIVVADEKTPRDWEYRDTWVISGSNGIKNHYAKKNIGYLAAIKNKADCIYDTDDDNIPNENWGLRFKETKASKSLGEGWFNAYEPMSTSHIWPRGFPLSQLKKKNYLFGGKEAVTSSIQQGLADGDPDIDAIHRMIFSKENKFWYDRSIYLDKMWCPFNSQSTWWFPDAYPLLYLPVNCTMRMTDIWRSFIAQRCLWEIGQGVTFHSPSEVTQERNQHDLMSDFEQEVPGYLLNEFIVELLSKAELKPGIENVCDNLFECYCVLAEQEIFPRGEIESVEIWINEVESARNMGRVAG